jgi:hypothetical protein
MFAVCTFAASIDVPPRSRHKYESMDARWPALKQLRGFERQVRVMLAGAQ